MRNLILMALDKAERLTDDELAHEIGQLESGKKKLRLRDERGRAVPLDPMILAVFRQEAEKRQKLTSAYRYLSPLVTSSQHLSQRSSPSSRISHPPPSARKRARVLFQRSRCLQQIQCEFGFPVMPM